MRVRWRAFWRSCRGIQLSTGRGHHRWSGRDPGTAVLGDGTTRSAAATQHLRADGVDTGVLPEYFRLADNLVAPRVPGAWHHRIVARRFAGDQPRLLGPGGTSGSLFLSDATPASADTWDRSWTAIGDPERDAFEALHLIYALFGVDVASNPDVDGDRVSVQRFRAA